MKPGTRCECVERECKAVHWTLRHNQEHIKSGSWQCEALAVRMVTVGRHYVGGRPPIGYVKDQVPMCAACAEHAEAGAQ